jgi:hypothetical protein
LESAPTATATMELPTRQSLRRTATAKAAPAPEAAPQPISAPAAQPVYWDEPRLSLAERLGPIGIILAAMLAAALTWILSMYLFQ